MPDYNLLSVAGELPPLTGGLNSSKSLVRNNSVATLNQIYQHQNSIPARNRILNTAKSLQQPSVDLADAVPACLSLGEPNLADFSSNYQKKQQRTSQTQNSVTATYNSSNSSSSSSGNSISQNNQVDQKQQPFLTTWASRVTAALPTVTTGLPQSFQLSSSNVLSTAENSINMPICTPSAGGNPGAASMRIQIINVARRHKKHRQRLQDPSEVMHKQASGFIHSNTLTTSTIRQESSADLTSDRRPRPGTASPLHHQSMNIERTYSTDSTSSTGSDCISSQDPPNLPIIAQNRNHNQPTNFRGGLLRHATLEVSQPPSGSRSPSPSRQQQILTSQISVDRVSPSHQQSGGSPRRRMLPQEPQVRPQNQVLHIKAFNQQADQIVANPISTDTDQLGTTSTSFKRTRKLPLIPSQIITQQQSPQQQQQQQQITNEIIQKSNRAKVSQLPRSNKSSLSSSSSSSNSPSVVPTVRPTSGSRSNSRVCHQLSGGELRVQSFPMPSTQQPTIDQQTSNSPKQQQHQLAVIYKKQCSSGSGSANTDSVHSPSPRSPIGANQQQQRPVYNQAYNSQARPNSNLSGLPNASSANNSPSLLQAARYFTFDTQSGFDQQLYQDDSNFVCYSPGGSRYMTSSNQGGASSQIDEPCYDNQQQQNMSLNNDNQLTATSYVEGLTAGGGIPPTGGTAGRGRRLSSCGSGLRANFLMNKQHAISEFTPPRSLESSTSRGSNDWPNIQPASDSCLQGSNTNTNNKLQAPPSRPVSSSGTVANNLMMTSTTATNLIRPSSVQNSAEQLRQQLAVESATNPRAGFRSNSATNIRIARNNSFGQPLQPSSNNYQHQGGTGGPASIKPRLSTSARNSTERESIVDSLRVYSCSGSTNLANQRSSGRTHLPSGLPPRAASATESTSTGVQLLSSSSASGVTYGGLSSGGGGGGEILNPNGLASGQQQARSMITVQTSTPSVSRQQSQGNYPSGGSNQRMLLAPGQQQPSCLLSSPTVEMVNSNLDCRRNSRTAASGPFVPTAVSIDVYHCGGGEPSTQSGRNSFEASYNGSANTTPSYANSISPVRGSQLIPQQRDRQPSNVSTNSMPAVASFQSSSLSPGSSSQFCTGQMHQQTVGYSSSATGHRTDINQHQQQLENQGQQIQQQQQRRKFGAWVEIIGTGGRWQRSANQLGTSKQSSNLSKSCSQSISSSSLASSSSSSLGPSNRESNSSVGNSSPTQANSSFCDNCPSQNRSHSHHRQRSSGGSNELRPHSAGAWLEQAARASAIGLREHLSSAGNSSSSLSSRGGVSSSGDSFYEGASTQKVKRAAHHRRIQNHPANNQASSSGATRRSRRGRRKSSALLRQQANQKGDGGSGYGGGSGGTGRCVKVSAKQPRDESTILDCSKQNSGSERTTTNYGDQLTLCDKLLLAERSVSKLFPKVDMASRAIAQFSSPPQKSSSSSNYKLLDRKQTSNCKAPPGEHMQPTGLTTGNSTHHQASNNNNNNNNNSDRPDDENGDDLSLFLRSAEKELEERRKLESLGQNDPNMATNSGHTTTSQSKSVLGKQNSHLQDLNLKRSWLQSLGKRQRSDLSQPASEENCVQPAGSSLRKTAVKVMRRAMTIKLVKNLANHRANSACEPVVPEFAFDAFMPPRDNIDNPMPTSKQLHERASSASASSKHHHLLSVFSSSGTEARIRRSADESLLIGNSGGAHYNSQIVGESPFRPASAGDLDQQESLSRRTVTKLKTGALFRRSRPASSINSSTELDTQSNHLQAKLRHYEQEQVQQKHPNNNEQQFRQPSSHFMATTNNLPSNSKATACLDANYYQQQQRSIRALNKMKSGKS